MNTVVIGLGEVGSETFKELHKLTPVIGVDINQERLAQFKKEGYNVTDKTPPADVYIIAVYTTEQVLSVLNSLNLTKNPLLVIESTIDPDAVQVLQDWSMKTRADVVLFPHRFNPNDPAHHVFNLNRIIGGTSQKAVDRAIAFYAPFMKAELRVVPFEIAGLSKVAENAYRFMEIALAQELKKSCEAKGISFSELRQSMNTKWNIDVKEARDGIGGKCLPKDMKLFFEYFEMNPLFKHLFDLNEQYKKANGK
jgi:UDP-N-acetyl-D-mannosaminuronic acid dehydrogenase